MTRFRKRPVEIEAKQFIDNHSALEIIAWSGDGKVRRQYDCSTGICTGLLIETLEGTMLAKPGDWIVRGVFGEFYPCRGDIFENTYEVVEGS